MLQAMQGFLAETPTVRVVRDQRDPDGRELRVVMTDILYRDGRPGSEFGRVRVMAWDEQADQLAKYQAGEEIQFIGRLNAARARDQPDNNGMAQLSFTIQRIDDSRTLVAAMEQFLCEFTPPQISLADKILRAEQQRQRNEAASREPDQSIHP